MMEKREKVVSSIANIYKLDGRVPLSKAIPFGLQHILAMFVANLTPIMMIGSASSVGQEQMTILLQNAMLSYVGAQYGYGAVVGAVIVGGIFEGLLGLLAKYWRKIITPVVSGVVVTTIGYSLLTVGVRSFGGGYTENFGSLQNIMVGTIT